MNKFIMDGICAYVLYNYFYGLKSQENILSVLLEKKLIVIKSLNIISVYEYKLVGRDISIRQLCKLNCAVI